LIPRSDAEVPAFTRALGLPGLTDLHLHFLPEAMQRKVWEFFDRATAEYGTEWPIHYRLPVDERLAILRDLGVRHFAPLVYPHKPDMAAWLNEWVLDFAAATPEAVPTATFFAEPSAGAYLAEALDQGVRCVKSHVQVGGYDPRDPLLDPVWGQLAEAGVPVVIHCGHGPVPGKFTGLDVFEDVLRRHSRLVVVLAHAGMPEFTLALELVERYAGVHIDTTMVGVPFNGADERLPADWAARLVGIADRVALGTDFPSIPYDYATQLRAIASWADADDRLGESFLRAVLWETPRRLLALGEQPAETS
jgi:predicted TIM-barrel fold metal-dependent hydrolase